jgi:hypothetical protein
MYVVTISFSTCSWTKSNHMSCSSNANNQS